VRLFVSATPDMEAELEAALQIVARLPLTIGWEIQRTPTRGKPLQPALEAVAECDLYVFLLGRDIAAPAGVEWDLARRLGKQPLAYEKDVLRFPAALAFRRDERVTWTPFGGRKELGELLQRALASHLRDRALHYGLSVEEYQALAALLETTQEKAAGPGQSLTEDRAAGAAAGGVILSPRDLPTGGVPVGPTKR
jgi:hypothetical protein